MRVFMREVIDLDKPVNLRELGWKEKIQVAIFTEIRNTKLWQYTNRRALNEKFKKQAQMDDMLKTALLGQIYKGLELQPSVSEVFLEVKCEYADSLDAILKQKEFSLYKIQRVNENSDIRLAYPQMPILLRCRKQPLEEVGI